MSVKEQVLQALEENKGKPLSGEMLAEAIGVSRTAVWKAINGLRKEGHGINAVSGRGYQLDAGSDVLSAQGIRPFLNFEGKSPELYIYDELDSTNMKAKELAFSGEVEEAVVVANKQTKGRGRLGRNFYSPGDTGIYMSFLIKPDCSFENSLLLTTAVSVAVCQAVDEVCGVSCGIKWVNDIYDKGKKVGGILTEAATDMQNGSLEYVIIGIGINCSTGEFPDDIAKTAGSLGGEFSRSRLIAEITNRFMPMTEDPSPEMFIDEYRRRSIVIGKNIKAYKGGYDKDKEGISAYVKDITNEGGLYVVYPSGKEEIISTGEISVRLEE